MMDMAKALVPGIHALGKTLTWEGAIPRPVTITEAQAIAAKAAAIPNILEELAFIRSEIERVTSISELTN